MKHEGSQALYCLYRITYTVMSLKADSVSGRLVTVLFSSKDQFVLQGGNHASPKTKISSVLFHN